MKAATLKEVSAERQPPSDIKTLRQRAREHIEDGAVTAGYAADRENVIETLNEALATELVCVLRYKRHYFMAQGIHSDPIASEFLQHANELLKKSHPETKDVVKADPASGQKYVRVYTERSEVVGRSAYCFISKATGDVLKADGWKRPAKGARGNIFTPSSYGVTPYGAMYFR